MYLQHFGLTISPFSLTPNTEFFFGLAPHVEALQVLQTALQTGEGFIKVVGEVGTGKTLICRKLINELSDDFYCAYLPNPYLTPSEIRWALAMELGIEYQASIDQQQLYILIQKRLFELAQDNKNVVLVLDEAQALPDKSLEALRLFTNIETEHKKLLQVVLFGQPELDERLSEAKFRQLRQRITFSYTLRALSIAETQAYINYRLGVAGFHGKPLFVKKQAKLIHFAARGIPRLINILSHKALLLCYGEGRLSVANRHIKFSINDTEDATKPKHMCWFYLGLFGLICLGVSLAISQHLDWVSMI